MDGRTDERTDGRKISLTYRTLSPTKAAAQKGKGDLNVGVDVYLLSFTSSLNLGLHPWLVKQHHLLLGIYKSKISTEKGMRKYLITLILDVLGTSSLAC